MDKNIVLTKREEELMDFLWEYGKPVTSNQIRELCESHSWRENYLQVMIRSLLKKGMIEQVGILTFGNHYARQLQCTMSKEEYFVALAAGKNLNKCHFAKAAVAMAAKESPQDRQALIEELEQMLKDFSNETEEENADGESK